MTKRMEDESKEWSAGRTIFTILVFLLAIAGLIALVNALGRADGSDGRIFWPQNGQVICLNVSAA